MLGISLASLWRRVRSGQLPVVRVLGRPRFWTDDIEAAMTPLPTHQGPSR